MTTTWNQLSRPLRLAIAAPWGVLVAAVTLGSTPAFRALLVNQATGQPTAAVSLSGSNWTGTLNPARLPAGVPSLDGDANLPLAAGPGGNVLFRDGQNNLQAYIGASMDGSLIFADPGGALYFANGAATLGYDGYELHSAAPIYSEDSLIAPAFAAPSGSTWVDDGNGGWSGPGQFALDNAGSVTIGASLKSYSRVLMDPTAGAVFYSPDGAAWVFRFANDGTFTVMPH